MQEPAPYKVYGTNEPYNGMTVEVGGFLYSTVGGALEGDSMQLVANPQPNPLPDLPPDGTTITGRAVGQITPNNNNTLPDDFFGPTNIIGVRETGGMGDGTGDGNGGNTGGGVGPGPQPNPNPGMSGQSNPSGGKTGPGQGGPMGGY